MMELKRCSRCFQYKELQKFSKCPSSTKKVRSRCKSCDSVDYKKVREKRLKQMSEYDRKNQKSLKEKKKKRYLQKRDKYLEKMRLRYETHKAEYLAKNANRKSKQIQATPAWLTKEDLEHIFEWYKLAKDLQWLSEEPLHVDHIIPLQSKEVCGLHVPWNLQILPASENIKKGNRLK